MPTTPKTLAAATARPTLCLTFDNMGSAAAIGRGELAGRGPDDEGPAGYPAVLDMLDRLELRATFFLEGWNAAHNPAAVLEVAARGHEIGVHGWVHENFHTLQLHERRRVLDDALTAFNEIGIRPVGFRAPGGVRGEGTEDILVDLAFEYDSSADHRPEDDPSSSFRLPGLLTGDLVNVPWRWSMIDYYHYFMHPSGERSPQQVKDYFANEFSAVQQSAVRTVIFHAWVSGQESARLSAIEAILLDAQKRGFDIVTAAEVASRFTSSR